MSLIQKSNRCNKLTWKKLLNLQKEQIAIEKMAADIENKRSETARNIPEVDHLNSETILNLANARATANKSVINGNIQ